MLDELPGTRSGGDLIVGTEDFDDAGIVRLDGHTALVLTVDIITPVSNDPEEFGEVAAANSLSDVFAMGGRVKAALNICCFPENLPREVTLGILRGGQRKVEEAGGLLVGGHSVEDNDLKYGLSVTGLIDPERILRNGAARAGDVLVLTKPLGTGVGISAEKMGLMRREDHRAMVRAMATLNAVPSALAINLGSRCGTDITGFGLAGHAFNIALASKVRLRFRYGDLPRYPWFEELWGRNARTKVTPANRKLVGDRLIGPASFREVDWDLCCDPQTSGGLLIALRADAAEEFVRRLVDQGFPARLIGEVLAGEPAIEFTAT